MADEGGVTLKIDADTASYITKLARLADAHKPITKEHDAWGEALEHITGKLTRLAGPLMVIEGIVEVVKGGFEGWHKALEKASETSHKLVSDLARTTAITGERRADVESQLLGTSSQLSISERKGAYAAYRAAAPDSAKTVSPGAIVAAASQGAIAGYDPERLAGIAGNLNGAFGGKSFDAAGLLMQKTGANADTGAEMIRRIAEKAGPGAAQQLAPYLLASAQAGDKRFSFVNGLVNGYNPAMGDFGSYLGQAQMRAPAGERGLAASIIGRVPGAQADIAGVGGFLSRRANEELQDPAVRSEQQAKFFTSNAEAINYQIEGEAARAKELKAARLGYNMASSPISAAMGAPNVVEFAKKLGGTWSGDDEASAALHGIAGPTAVDHLEDISGHLRTQNAILDRRTLNPRAHEDP